MAVLAVWTLLLLTPAPVPAAAPVPVPAISAPVLSAPGVVVQLGTASLEEYTQGNPNLRIQLERGG